MKVTRSRAALWIVSGLLLLISGCAWLSYVGNGMAYGGIVGLRGRENDIVNFGAKAMRSLFAAVAAEGCAVGAITWGIAAVDSALWVRLAKALAVAIIATGLTFALVRGM